MFDKEDSGYIAVGEIKYILTQLGERMDEGEVEEVLKMADVGPDGQVNYEVRRKLRRLRLKMTALTPFYPNHPTCPTGLHQGGARRLKRLFRKPRFAFDPSRLSFLRSLRHSLATSFTSLLTRSHNGHSLLTYTHDLQTYAPCKLASGS